MQLVEIFSLLILLLISSFTFFVIICLIIKSKLETISGSLIVCLSIDVIEIIPGYVSMQHLIRMHLMRPWTYHSSIQLCPVFFISSLSLMFALFLIDLLRLFFFLGVPVNQHIRRSLILIDSCDFEYNILYLDNILTINNNLLGLLLKLFLLPDVILIEILSWRECDNLEDPWLKIFIFTYLVDSLEDFDSHA